MNNLTSFDKMKALFNVSKTVKEFLPKYKDMLKDKGNVDKYALVFRDGNSDRFNSAKFSFYLESYYGHYGSSSCYTRDLHSGIDTSTFNKAVVNFLNKNKQMFFDGISAELEIMAQAMLVEAESEVAKLNAALEEVKNTSADVVQGE
jgi:hypothetical protein